MIDLCVVGYNSRLLLNRLIDNIKPEERGGLYRLFIQDNASTDGTEGYLTLLDSQKWLDDWAISANVGYAYACNRLASRGWGDIIGLMNADVWLTVEDLQAIQKFFDDNPDVAIMGPKQRDENGRITHAGIFGTNKAPKHRAWQLADPMDRLYRDVREAVTVSGSAYFIRRDVWNTLADDGQYRKIFDRVTNQTAELLSVKPEFHYGPFLPTPFYYEETFCSYYARHEGFKLVYNGEISIGHSWHGSVETGSFMDKMFRPSSRFFAEACDELGIEHDQ